MVDLRRDLRAKHQLMDDLQAPAHTQKMMRRGLAVPTRRTDAAITALGCGALPLEVVKPTKSANRD